jgi:hypothetical protein
MTFPPFAPFRTGPKPFRGAGEALPTEEPTAEDRRAATVEMILCAAMVAKGQASTMDEARRIRRAGGK